MFSSKNDFKDNILKYLIMFKLRPFLKILLGQNHKF